MFTLIQFKITQRKYQFIIRNNEDIIIIDYDEITFLPLLCNFLVVLSDALKIIKKIENTYLNHRLNILSMQYVCIQTSRYA